ncbi:MAG: VIT1/CCC1 transporter family protein [Candidatus Peribacteraceae bacterium]|jgi:VIT1/CCC1 family predicted Fe2+/Mn2+ transporter
MNQRNIEQALKKHREAAIHGPPILGYVNDIVYGANDGIVTTFAVVAGSVGASLPDAVLIILGLANVFADGSSMGLGAFLNKRTERDNYRRLLKEELKEIEHDPEIEREEVREAYRAKGLTGEQLEKTVEILTADKLRWATIMVQEEHGITEDASANPILHGIITYASFAFFGSIPLLSYFLGIPPEYRFITAILSTFSALLILGLIRSLITRERLFQGPLEIVSIGIVGATIAYSTGIILKTVFGVTL